jgi:hypothetical protein
LLDPAGAVCRAKHGTGGIGGFESITLWFCTRNCSVMIVGNPTILKG